MKQDFFQNNRKRLYETLADVTIAVMFAGEAPSKSGDEDYPFVPNRNFYYLTGIAEPKVIFMAKKSGDTVEEWLFIEKPDPVMEKWVGKTISEDEAKEASGIDNIAFLETFTAQVHRALQAEGVECISLNLERSGWEAPQNAAHAFAGEIREKYPHVTLANMYQDICELRVRKSPEEVDEIRKAIDVTREGIENIMSHASPGMMEYEMEAFFDYTLHSHGIREHAFPTIAGAGVNGTILHYGANNTRAQDGELVLFDLGAQYEYYNADITRTIPVNGKFSDRQKQFYNIVLNVLNEVTAMMKPGLEMAKLQQRAKELLADGCRQLGLIEEDKELASYYWHGVGHFLGLDTHDVGRTKGRVLEPGMIVTVEPGLYAAEEAIGIRIEDDILVTEDGYENLSKDIIRTAEEIEAFMGQR